MTAVASASPRLKLRRDASFSFKSPRRLTKYVCDSVPVGATLGLFFAQRLADIFERLAVSPHAATTHRSFTTRAVVNILLLVSATVHRAEGGWRGSNCVRAAGLLHHTAEMTLRFFRELDTCLDLEACSV